MRIEFSSNDYLQVEVVAPGTAGIAYDCRLRASMRCGEFSGTSEAWADGGDVGHFIHQLRELGQTMKGRAALASDDGSSLIIEVVPINVRGHFALRATLAKGLTLSSKSFEASAAGAFEFESARLSEICRLLEQSVKVEGDA
jgi:hypothetical protein